MGHEATSRAGQQRGSAMGAHNRHTTAEMAGRIAMAIEQRLTVVLKVAKPALEATRTGQHSECSSGHWPRFWQISGKWGSEWREKMRCVVYGTHPVGLAAMALSLLAGGCSTLTTNWSCAGLINCGK